MTARIDPQGIIREMAYTPLAASCRDPLLTADWELVECRRDKRHVPAGVHAVHGGHGANSLIVWGDETTSTEL